MLKKHIKITVLLKADTDEVNKEQELVEEIIEEEVCASVKKERILEET